MSDERRALHREIARRGNLDASAAPLHEKTALGTELESCVEKSKNA
jgi:hypothetical protein